MNKNNKMTLVAVFGLAVSLFVFGFARFSLNTKPNYDEGIRQVVASEEKEAENVPEEVEELKEWVSEVDIEELVPFDTQEIKDDDLEKGKTKVAQEGKDGIKLVTYNVTFLGEVEVGREELKSIVTIEPEKEIIMIGNKVLVVKEDTKEPTPVVAPKQETKPVVTPKPETKPVVAPKPEPTPVVTPKPETKPVVTPKPEPTPVVTPKPEPTPVVEPVVEEGKVTVPNGTGMHIDKFKDALGGEFTLSISSVYHDTVGANLIIKMVTPPGVYDSGDNISVQVSLGKEPVDYTENTGGNQSLELPRNYNSSFASGVEQEIARLVSEYRVANGLNALAVKSDLTKTSRYKSDSMLQHNYFAHTNPQLGGIGMSTLLFDRFNVGYSGVGENLHAHSGGTGYATAEMIMTSWKNSPGHNANMLKPDWKYIGVGVVTSPNSGNQFKTWAATIATQHFGY